MHYIGLDVHKQSVSYCSKAAGGELVWGHVATIGDTARKNACATSGVRARVRRRAGPGAVGRDTAGVGS